MKIEKDQIWFRPNVGYLFIYQVDNQYIVYGFQDKGQRFDSVSTDDIRDFIKRRNYILLTDLTRELI